MRLTHCKPTDALLFLLEQEGYDVKLLVACKGFWRRQDTYRWEAHATCLADRVPVWIYSWDTITRCARRGIKCTPDARSVEIQVSAL
jgi:hypothetical protein